MNHTTWRPFWSVMVPTYNPRSNYLETTLRSILQQAPGKEDMQIEVIDDCSPNGLSTELVRQLAGDRIIVTREPHNLGLAGIWNRCIERAHGEWIHILHQDDLVLPGFYQALRKGAESSASIGAVCCRHAFIDFEGHWLSLSHIERRLPGILNDAWIETMVISQRIQTPSIVVRRSVYDSCGGFRSDLRYTLDWEMWCRILGKYRFWYEPSILACYRFHDKSQTNRLAEAGIDIMETARCIDANVSILSVDRRGVVRRLARNTAALGSLNKAKTYFSQNHLSSAIKQLSGALRCSCSIVVLWRLSSLVLQMPFKFLKHSLRTKHTSSFTPLLP